MILLLLACSQERSTVAMIGAVYDGPPGEGEVVPGAVVASFDRDAAPVATATADAEGIFEVAVYPGEPFFVTASSADGLPTSFSGTAYIGDFYAGDGLPWIASPALLAEAEVTFAGCPGVGEGALVIGEIRRYLGDLGPDSYPVLPDATAALTDTTGEVRAPCYLDDEGVYDPEAEAVGTTGTFAFFGVPAGPLLVSVADVDVDGQPWDAVYAYLVAEGGVVPMYPAVLEEGVN